MVTVESLIDYLQQFDPKMAVVLTAAEELDEADPDYRPCVALDVAIDTLDPA